MKCRDIEIHAIAYLDGKLARNEAVAVERHLAGCSACAERLHGFSDVSSRLDGWEPVQPSPSFNARLERRILAEPATSAGWRERISFWFQMHPSGRPALAGALLGMMLFAVVLARYNPSAPFPLTPGSEGTQRVGTVSDGNDELALYRDLPVLEELDLLSNFEVLQEFETTTQ
ncbi:MAG: zf-HC2 domain-containing protein [Acidobacteria bacterium]|nr:zf-HC2 domain-containing protein [Acidobacteriota bacterium]